MIFTIMRLKNLSAQDKFIYIVGFVLAILTALTLHEFAHAIVAKWNGDSTAKDQGRVTINPLKHIDVFGFILILLVGFGWAKPVPVNPSLYKKQRLGIFTVSSAGIFMNMILGSLSLAILYSLAAAGATQPTNAVLLIFFKLFVAYITMSASLNICLMAFNALPFFPLDGYHMLYSFFKKDNKFLQISRKYGANILLALILIGSLLGRIRPWLDPLGLYLNTVFTFVDGIFMKLFAA